MQWSKFSFQLILFTPVFNFMTISWCWSMGIRNLNPLYCCSWRNENSCLSCWCPLPISLVLDHVNKNGLSHSYQMFGPNRVLAWDFHIFDTIICAFTSDTGFERSNFIWTDTSPCWNMNFQYFRNILCRLPCECERVYVVHANRKDEKSDTLVFPYHVVELKMEYTIHFASLQCDMLCTTSDTYTRKNVVIKDTAYKWIMDQKQQFEFILLQIKALKKKPIWLAGCLTSVMKLAKFITAMKTEWKVKNETRRDRCARSLDEAQAEIRMH